MKTAKKILIPILISFVYCLNAQTTEVNPTILAQKNKLVAANKEKHQPLPYEEEEILNQRHDSFYALPLEKAQLRLENISNDEDATIQEIEEASNQVKNIKDFGILENEIKELSYQYKTSSPNELPQILEEWKTLYDRVKSDKGIDHTQTIFIMKSAKHIGIQL